MCVFLVTRDKRVDLQRKQTSRSVFQCHVIGPRGVGKTTFLQGFLGRNLNYVATLNKDHMSRFAANIVPVYGQDRYLVVSHSACVRLCVRTRCLHLCLYGKMCAGVVLRAVALCASVT